jgi:O-antigen/teichoic acid export membrane protein
MNEVINKIQTIAGKKRVKQASVLYISLSIGVLVGIGVSVLNTRLLGPEQYGDFKFLQSLFNFAVTFVTLGIFYSGGRLIAIEKEKSGQRQLIGGISLLAIGMSIVLFVLFFIFSYFEESIFDNELGWYLRILSPFLFIFPFQLGLDNILQGSNRIYQLSAFRLGPKVLYLVGILIYSYFFPFNLDHALIFHFSAFGAIIIMSFLSLKPHFTDLSGTIRRIFIENRTYGFQVYIGAITGLASAQLAGLAIGYFIDNTNVGFFALAITASQPLAMIPNSIGTTFFRDFTSMERIPPRVFWTTILVSVLSLAAFLLIIKQLVIFLYTEEYLAVVPLAYFVSIGSMLHGLGDFFNRFLAAHGKGKELRNSNIIIGVCNVLGYVLLTWLIGIQGAAITKLLAGIVYVLIMTWYYLRLRRNANHAA